MIFLGENNILSAYPQTMYIEYPPTPADGKGERVRAERLGTTRNTTTVLGKLSKVAEQQQQQAAGGGGGDLVRFLVGFQKGRFGLRGTCYCD